MALIKPQLTGDLTGSNPGVSIFGKWDHSIHRIFRSGFLIFGVNEISAIVKLQPITATLIFFKNAQ